MNKSTIIKAVVAGTVVVTGILLGDNEMVRGRLNRVMNIASDVEKAIKNPLGSLASVTSQSYQPTSMGYYDWKNKQDERQYEMERLKLQQAHEERMAQLKADNVIP